MLCAESLCHTPASGPREGQPDSEFLVLIPVQSGAVGSSPDHPLPRPSPSPFSPSLCCPRLALLCPLAAISAGDNVAPAVDRRLRRCPVFSLFLSRTSTHSLRLTQKRAPHPPTSPLHHGLSGARAVRPGQPGQAPQKEPEPLLRAAAARNHGGLWGKDPRSHHSRVTAPVPSRFRSFGHLVLRDASAASGRGRALVAAPQSARNAGPTALAASRHCPLDQALLLPALLSLARKHLRERSRSTPLLFQPPLKADVWAE